MFAFMTSHIYKSFPLGERERVLATESCKIMFNAAIPTDVEQTNMCNRKHDERNFYGKIILFPAAYRKIRVSSSFFQTVRVKIFSLIFSNSTTFSRDIVVCMVSS